MENKNNKLSGFRIAGLGEVLWDVFPHLQRLGGAPANFASHCQQLGSESFAVSAIGDDDLGKSAVVELKKLGVNTDFLQVCPSHPTGRVLIQLDELGKPKYQILEDVAWDQLKFTNKLKQLATTIDAVCFGSLAQRSDQTRQTVRKFLQHMPEHALKILDVNLRQPFFSKSLIEESLHFANIVKLSDEELPILAAYFGFSGTVKEQLTALREKFSLRLVAYTRGADGSILLTADECNQAEGVETNPIDSVGAGDSFTAAMCMGLLLDQSLSATNQLANRVASYVCSQVGATPTFPAELTQQLVHS